jgi:hypothetical protein
MASQVFQLLKSPPSQAHDPTAAAMLVWRSCLSLSAVAAAERESFGGGRDMRTFISAFLVCLGLLATFRPCRADDKEEKERREKLEKQLAELEPTLEKEEWAVERKKIIAELKGHLDKADRIDLFRLNPKELPEGNKEAKKEFHGYEVLSELRVEANDQRNTAAAFLGKTLHWNELRKALCFNPRHGLRVLSGKRTLDFLICFQCNRVDIFEGCEQLATLPLGFTDKNNPIERLIAQNEKKPKERK